MRLNTQLEVFLQYVISHPIMKPSQYCKIPKILTKLDKQDSRGRYCAIGVGSHTLKVAGVRGVQVSDS